MINISHEPSFIENKDSKSAVIFVHGFMGSPRQFDRMARFVYKNGFSAAVLLLPGHGKTLKDFATCTYRQWKEHVKSEIDRLSEGFDDIWLVGHSMGGLLVLSAALYPNPKVRGVFPIACPFELTFLSKADIKVRMLQILGNDENIKEEYLDKNSIPRSSSLLFHALAPMVEVKKLMRATKSSLPRIRTPVTAVYSISDELISIKSLEILKSGLAKAHFEHVVLTDSLHAYYTADEKEKIEQALLEFIS